MPSQKVLFTLDGVWTVRFFFGIININVEKI